MPGARRAASAAAYQSKIYVINGVTSGVINSSYIYDPATDSYTAGPNGLMATFHQAAVVLNGQLYRIGGDTTTGNPTNTVEIYGDHYVASLPQGLALPMAVAYGGYIYVAGATPAGWDVKTYRYDPVSDSWSDVAIADLPVARAGGASGILNGKWILAGGTSEGGNSAIAWDPASNTWESITPMFAGRGNVGGGTIGNAFYVVGGSGHDGATTDTQQYLPTACAGPSPTPTSVPASPTPWPAVTPTGITQCHIVVTQASTYCTLPDIYNYEFHLQPVCSNYNVTLYLEASPDVGGPWTNITEQTITQGSSSTIQGSIQADIPAQYQWYRIRLFGQAIPWSFTGETDPVRICNRPGYCPLSWNARSPYPFTVEDHAIAAQGDSLYSFGGHSGSSNTPLDLAYKYSPTTNTWTSIASLPAGRRDASAASGNGYVYIVNGSNSSGETDTLYRYDPVANSYTSLGQGLLPTTYQAAVYLNGLLYRIGGSTPTGPLPMRATDTVEVYGDHFVAPMPERLVLHMAVALNGYIYVAGGVNGDGAGSLKAYRYDPVSDSWSDSAIADLPLVRQSAVSVALDGKWVIAGGSMDNATTSVISWDPSTNTWSSLTPMGVRRTNAAGAVIDNALYVIGGSAGSGTLADNEEYLPAGCVTATPTMTTTATATATTTATVTDTAVPTTPTTCPINFTDVPGDHTFYSFIRCLACRGIISGYSDGTFKPGNEITRGQIAKMVSNAAGYEDEIPPDQQTFEDVPPDHPFWLWIERLVLHGVMGGYPCGADVEPCNPPGSRPYFRPFNNTTRGQLAKIVSNAAGLGGDPAGQFYTDVPPSHPFYVWIMRLTNLGAMSGYPCGGEAEPCDDANRPYFRPYANVTRGQASKIVANTYYPNCETP
jgi:N-acetylneuraminic acid mutarotase